MGLTKIKKTALFLEGNNLIKDITNDIENETVILVPPKTSVIYKDQNKTERFMGESEYLYIKDSIDCQVFCINMSRFDNCRNFIDVHGEDANINGFVYFTWRIFKPEVFITKFKEGCQKNDIIALIFKQVEKDIEKSYNENSLVFRKNIRRNINKLLYTFGIRVINIEFEGLISLNENAILKDIGEDILVMEMEEVLPACKNCGYQPNGKPPKFCPECGTKFEV